eukprot:COSAG01_NODE_671_length_14345_cov_229.934728_12_plen_98_part_00
MNIATKGSAIDSSDAAEILVMILFGLRVTSTDGWDIYFNREGGIEVALGDCCFRRRLGRSSLYRADLSGTTPHQCDSRQIADCQYGRPKTDVDGYYE